MHVNSRYDSILHRLIFGRLTVLNQSINQSINQLINELINDERTEGTPTTVWGRVSPTETHYTKTGHAISQVLGHRLYGKLSHV